MGKKSDRNKKLRGFGKVSTKPRHFVPVRGYENLVGDLWRHLKRGHAKSFVLVGESGVGKSSVLKALFRGLVDKDGGGWTVVETSTSQVLRGTRYLGEWETRLTNLAELAEADEKVLLYVTDVQNLHGAGRGSNDNGNMADALAPYLERGKVILVGECTPEAFRKGIENVPSIHNSLTAFNLLPTRGEDTVELVRYAFDDLRKQVEEETARTLELPEVTLAAIEQFGGIYFPGTAQPGASIQLLQQIVEKRRDELDRESDSEPSPLASSAPIELDHRDIISALHRLSGLPMDLLDDSIPLSEKAVREFFDARVIGQDEAVAKVIDVVTLIKAGLADPGKPVSVMLFAGPTGVGKTELAKALAEFLFGSQDRMIRCDMSEYKDFNSFEKLIGRPGSGDKGSSGSPSLATRVRQKPFSVVLLDEIEKSHPNVFDVLLQAFDDGRLSDPGGNTTNLTQTIIIMTSNLGSDLAAPQPLGFDRKGADQSETVQKALREFFRPEFLNRLDHVVRFRALQRDHMRTLARRELGRALLRGGLLRRELRVDPDPAVIDLLVKKGYSELYGARPLRRAVEEYGVLPVAHRIVRLGDKGRGALLRLLVKNGKVVVVAVEDRQTRAAERITRGVEVVDPVDGAKKKVSAAAVRRELDQLAESLLKLQEECIVARLDERKSELLERSGAIDFWDEPRAARDTLSEIYRIERLMEAVTKTLERHDGLARKFDIVKRAADAKALSQLVLDLRAVEHFAELVRYGLKCGDREDRRDALVAIRLVDDNAEADLVAKLAGSYLQWAQRKGYGVRVIHEEAVAGSGVGSKSKLTREVVLEIAGPAVYGVLRAEEGSHEFVFGKTARLPRRNRFVSVRVLGTPAAEPEAVDMRVRAKASRGAANVADRIRARVAADDRVSGKSVAIVSPLPVDQAEEAAEELLAAEIERATAQGSEAESVVRKYELTPTLTIRDRREPKINIKPREFWRGEIDELLRAGIGQRQGQRGDADGA